MCMYNITSKSKHFTIINVDCNVRWCMPSSQYTGMIAGGHLKLLMDWAHPYRKLIALYPSLVRCCRRINYML